MPLPSGIDRKKTEKGVESTKKMRSCLCVFLADLSIDKKIDAGR
jgi:hypothetical protein